MVVIIRLTVFKGSTKTFNDHEGIDALPQDLLAQVLASLERRSLRTARLVCRAFRAASIPCVTCLNYNCETQMMLGNLLLHSLRVFTCVVDLNLLGDAGSVAGVLREPGVLPRLRELRLSGEDEEDEGASGIADLVPLLLAATRLTYLEVLPLTLSSDEAATHLARALEQVHLFCPFLHHDAFAADAAQIREVLRKRTLRDFYYISTEPDDLLWEMPDDAVWESVLADQAHLTHLQALEEVPLRSQADCEALAAHTQLTRLTVMAQDDVSVPLTLLSRLSALQVLRLPMESPPLYEVGELVAPMASLQSLSLESEVCDPDLSQMDALLAAIPTLTKLAGLSIRATAGTILPEGPRPNGFAGLRSLRLTLDLDGIGECGNFAAALAGLEFLMLSCDSDTWHKLAPHMPAMPRLTELQIYAHPPESLGYPSARFLAGLPRLRCLKLQNALAPSRWDEEVLYIAALTELTKLGISFPRWFHEASGYIHASMTWTQVQPLTALRQLDIVEVAPLLEAGVANRFCDSLRQVRQEMDLPLQGFCRCVITADT